MRGLGNQLIAEHDSTCVSHDGILYMMFRPDDTSIVPLYIGKTEVYGRGDKNLSANVRDLKSGDANFGRWGYNYAYHLGDLSAATLPGHPESKRTPKYVFWRNRLFESQEGLVKPKFPILFWATLWGPDSCSIWPNTEQQNLPSKSIC